MDTAAIGTRKVRIAVELYFPFRIILLMLT